MADINEKDILLHQGEPAEAEPAIDAEQGKTDLSAAEALEHEGGLNTAAQSIPDTLPVLPVRDVVIFNYMILPLFIGRDKSVQAVDAALKTGRHLLVCAQKEESTEDPKPEDLYEVGTVVQVMRMLKMPDSRVKILVQGVSRARVTGYRQVEPFLEARIETLPEQIPVVDATVEALLRSVREQSEKVLTLRGLSSPDVLSVLQGVDDPGRLADLIAANYFEVVAAPDFEEGVLEKLAARKNLRIFKLPALARLGELAGVPFLDVKSMADGGIILQQSFVNRIRSAADFIPAVATTKDGLTVSARKPTPQEADDLVFAWAVEAGVTSNSVIFAHNGATVAIGTGEQDRVGCVELAIFKAYTKYADTLAFTRHGMTLYELKLKAKEDAEAAEQLAAIEADTQKAKGGLAGTVLVSDGFFPFRDGVDVCIAQGVTAIAQPGGSLRDYEVIGAVNEASPQVAMVFTGQRSFKH